MEIKINWILEGTETIEEIEDDSLYENMNLVELELLKIIPHTNLED